MANTAGKTFKAWFVPIGIIVIAGLLITLVLLQLRGAPADAEGADGAGAAERGRVDLSFVEGRDPADVQAAGPTDAPVALVVYSDYQCPFCAKWSRDTLPGMLRAAEAGKLRIEWRDVNQYGENSERASRAAHAAGKQGKFWEFHEALFPEGEHLSPEGLSEAALVTLAETLGLDTAQFVADFGSDETLFAVRSFAQAGKDLGVSGTPTFVLGGEPIVGAQPESVFTAALERKLAEAERAAGAGK